MAGSSAGGSEGGYRRRCKGVYDQRQRAQAVKNGFWVLYLLLSAACTTAAGAKVSKQQLLQQQRWKDIRAKRSGDVAGLEDGRISLARVATMLTSSVHLELVGSEDAFHRALDHEWDNLSLRPAGTRGSFLVCSAPGRANAKRLRELAGADSLVETLYRRRGEILCSLASLDADTAALVAADDGSYDGAQRRGGVGRHGTFSLEPLPHFAKLAPMVAADPSPAAQLLSSEAALLATEGWGDRDGAGTETGVEDGEDGGGSAGDGGRRLRAPGAGSDKMLEAEAEKGRLSAEQRARVMADAVAAGADRPRTRRLIQDGQRGIVDAIEITLVNHHERRSKSETEELARRWLSLASDQSGLAKTLRAEHFWGRRRGLSHDDEDAGRADGEDDAGEEGKGRRRLPPEEADILPPAAEEERAGERARELVAHEERKRQGWADVLDAVDRGQDRPAGRGEEDAGSAGSCRFDRARFTVSPGGNKVLLHRPHEMAAAAAAGSGGGSGGAGGDDDGCLSALLGYISLQPEVRYVTARRKSVTMNLAAAWVSQSGVDGYTPLWDENLQGQDEIIGVADTGLDMNHCQFREDDGDNVEASDWEDPVTDLTKRKVVQYIEFVDDFDEEGGHGTHVAGTLAGAQSGEDAGDDEGDGMAFQGKLAVFDFGDSDNFNVLSTPDAVDEVILQPAYDGGARVHSNSWDTVSIEYTSLSKEMDEFVYTHQDFLVVFAAGNCGDTTTDDLTDNCTILDDDEGTVLSPAQGKNVVAVGASESAGVSGKDPDTVSFFSSKGPTIDGRIKPDIVAPGDPNWSAYADPTGETCEFGIQQGTSMATPVVAGNAAMARQYFREGWYNGARNLTQGFDPSAALLKAVLINSATAMSFVGVNPESSTLDVTLADPPDIHQGFGRVTMVNALNINATVGLFFEDWVEIREGETLEYEVSLYEDADLDKDLRITLVWTDPPASVGSTSALIHDLDLVVIAQSTGTEYYPNGGDGADSVNNVERVVITDTTEGETYTIRVSCIDLSEADTQNFAVVANGEFIKTNDLPTVQDPSDWLDLVDQAAANIFTWRFGAVLALGVLGCCAISCACRRFNRTRAHQSKVNRYRREITANRGGGGRKMRPNPMRPTPYDGPMRGPLRNHPGELNVTGPGRFQESWRRPGPGSIGGRSLRSMRSEQSARGALLTGAGAVVPGQFSDGAQEACPECGLRLPDVVQLVMHVETQHGGRANRNRGQAEAAVAAAAVPEAVPTSRTSAGLKVVRARAVNNNGNGRYDDGVPVVTVAPSRKASAPPPPPPRTGNPYADARAVANTKDDVEKRPSPSSRPRSKSPVPRGRDPGASAVGRSAAATAAGATAAARARGAGGRSPSRTRSKSPGTSRTSSGSSSKPRSGSPPVSGSSPGRSGHSGSGESGASVSRHSLPRIKDLGGQGKGGGGKAVPGVNDGSGRSPLPRILSHRRPEGGRRGGSGESAGSGGSSGTRGSTDRSRGGSGKTVPSSHSRRDGASAGSGSRSSNKAAAADKELSSTGGAYGGGGERDRGGGRGGGGGERGRAPGFEHPGRPLEKGDSARSLTRTSSLDRMSALSSRAITRSNARKADDAHAAVDGRGGGAGADSSGRAARQAREKVLARRRVRRNASTEDNVPTDSTLTADRLRDLGSGLPEGCKMPKHVFSPVGPVVNVPPKEPAYSPVDRDRAGELDEEPPVSKTRKFFRQLSGDA
eukprot:g2698.t1